MDEKIEYQIFIGCHDQYFNNEYVTSKELKELIVDFFASREVDFSLFYAQGGYLYEDGNFQNTLIVGAPGSGKTTLLRDLIRQISNGNKYAKGLNVGVVDERNELASMYKGMEQTDLGLRTDVIAGIPKTIGIKILIRSMAPEVIAVDEVGGLKDAENINFAMCSGAKALLTCHGNSISDVKMNSELQELLQSGSIEKIVVLSQKEKEKTNGIYFLNKEKREYMRECI